MNELLNMDLDELKAQMDQVMGMLTSTDMMQNIVSQKEDVLAMMEAQGTATPAEIAEFRYVIVSDRCVVDVSRFWPRLKMLYLPNSEPTPQNLRKR